MARVRLATAVLLLSLTLTACGTTTQEDISHPDHSDATELNVVSEWPEADIVPVAAGDSAIVKFRSAGRDRSFILSVPASYDPAVSWPVVFAFHGKDETAAKTRSYTQLDRSESLVVYGEGVARAWAPAPYAETSIQDDITYVRDILAMVSANYTVGENRVAATGFSNGGGFAVLLGCRAPELVSAVAPVGAAFYDDVFANCSHQPIPFLGVHGTDDAVKNYGGGSSFDQSYKSNFEVYRIMRERNGCSGEGEFTQDTPSAVHVTYESCDAPLVHIRNEGGTHRWPGTTYDPTPGMPIGYTTDLILGFFDVLADRPQQK
ncbi:alpha/beta hydrolase family esterase [Corynebacterium guangdongense]|uniref:Polyhydroxybutyrate depolymerase n=1 Tax=Corynebacterium guangdongense TaxID=1783348 RepID=A0ABU2A0Y0_9CORY|nr:alpha/beta hydrolase-fold protein [Corynebacterium guangdongense]MDR7330842.1 polyhydroxybutyrate depolymerase [Corynebacterium guangdongense]WJZ16857.1 Phospholipase/Carboxylesterase [Corynebacterium guangdongense]